MATPLNNGAPLSGNPLPDGMLEGGKWDFGGGAHNLTYTLNTTGYETGSWTSARVTQIDAAFQAWADVANLTFTRTGIGGLAWQSTADMAIGLTGTFLSRTISATAIGGFPDTDANYILPTFNKTRASYPKPEGDVFLDDGLAAFNSWFPGGRGFQVTLHEIGHALGLKHPHDDGGNQRPTFRELGLGDVDSGYYTVMSYADVGSNNSHGYQSTPMPFDILAIQELYGANTSYHAGDDVYTFTQDHQTRTLWDAGGYDTFDASGLGTGATLDVRDGGYSYPAGNSDTTLAIAYDVDIEKVIGTPYGDTIKGGDGGVTFEGHGGADLITGGSGNDIYVVGAYSTGIDLIDRGGADVVRFDASVARAGVSFSLYDNHSLLVSSSLVSLRIKNFYSTTNRVESFTFGDGSVLSYADILSLVPGNQAPDPTATNFSLTSGEWRRASVLGWSFADAENNPVNYVRIEALSTNDGAVRLWYNGAYADSVVAPLSNLANVWFQGGSAVGLYSSFVINATDLGAANLDTGVGETFRIATRGVNRAPVVASTGQNVTAGGSVAAGALISVTDADGDTPTVYRFWDTAGGGYFTLNGVTQASSQNIDVSAANLASLAYVGGARAGSETLWAQAYDGGLWSAWTSWSEQTIRTTNTLSVVSAANRNTSQMVWLRGAELGITVADADGDAPVTYEITDGNSGAGSARLWLSGNYLAQGAVATISADQWANFWVQGGSDVGTDTLSVRVGDGYGWSNSASFTLSTRSPNRAPVVTSAGQNAVVGQGVAAGSLINVTDADGDMPTLYRFWDSAGGGYFTLNGVTQASSQNIDVSSANLANLAYVGAARTGSEVLWAQAYDGSAWSAWTSWNEQTIRTTNTLSVVSATNKNTTQMTWLRGSELGIVISDADGDAPVTYEVTDGNAGASSARFWLSGSYQAQGAVLTFSADQWANFWVQGGSGSGIDSLSVRVNDGYGWSNSASFTLNTRLPNRAPAVSVADAGVTAGTSVAPTTFFSVSDADGDAMVTYRFWDTGNTDSYFSISGVHQVLRANIDVAAADIGNVQYYTGSANGRAETLWVQVYDGSAWSDWKSWKTTATAAPPVASSGFNLDMSQVGNLDSLSGSSYVTPLVPPASFALNTTLA